MLGGRVEVDASLFHNDIKNGVTSYIDPALGAFRTTYQDYRTDGFELQGRARITRGLMLTSGVGYIHSTLGRAGANGNTVAGNGVPNIPEWTVTVGPRYETPVGTWGLPGSFSLEALYNYTADRPADIQNAFDLKAYHILDARIGWTDASTGLQIYAFGRNLLNQRAETFGALFLGQKTVAVVTGRIVGLGIGKSL